MKHDIKTLQGMIEYLNGIKSDDILFVGVRNKSGVKDITITTPDLEIYVTDYGYVSQTSVEAKNNMNYWIFINAWVKVYMEGFLNEG